MSDITRKQFDFLSWLTGLVVLSYVGASIWAMIVGGTSFADFSGAIGPLAGLLLGYWVRGANGQPTA